MESKASQKRKIPKIPSKKLANLCLLDDIIFSGYMDDNAPAVETILRIVLDMPDIRVSKVHAQKPLKSGQFKGKGARLDVLAVDEHGNKYDIEVQNANTGDLPRRARYYLSLLTATSLGRGKSYNSLKPCYVIFLTKGDVFGEGEPVYWFQMAREKRW